MVYMVSSLYGVELIAGRVESTYEPAMTKAYLHGRTESIRTVQPESFNFVKVSHSYRLQLSPDILLGQGHTARKDCSTAGSL
jgi:hypothetical protein